MKALQIPFFKTNSPALYYPDSDINSHSSMRILVISDVHGLLFWKEAASRAAPETRVIFLGDYFDRRGAGPFAASQTENFLEICALARGNPGVQLLLGNHDFQYADFARARSSSYDKLHCSEFNKALMDNLDLLDIVHIDRTRETPIIFSHAGVSRTFMDECQIGSVDAINDRFRQNPEYFEFQLFHKGEFSDLHGDDIWQSPLWIRPYSLMMDAIEGFDQVVGHTQTLEIEKLKTAHGDSIFLTCTFNSQCPEFP